MAKVEKENTKVSITYKELLGTPTNKPIDSINYLLDREDFPVVFGHKISKLSQAVTPEIEHANTIFNKLVKKHGHLTEDKSQYVIDQGSKEEAAFSKEYTLFLNEAVTLNIDKISLSEIATYSVKPRHLHSLHQFFKD